MTPNKKIFYLTASEFDWNLSDETTINAWGFNRQLPGPEMRVKKGDEVIVNFTNYLNEPTMIHWHGIRLPASMDGTGEVQKPVLPGESFEYRFIVPDAGTFWYHSHSNETIQVERGMYGSLIVEDDSDPVTDNDRVFMIDDMKLDDENNHLIHSNFLKRFAERHDGREGNVLLINGKENTTINIYGGQMERWRFINSSNARYFKFSLNGKDFKVIGSDGGLIESPQIMNEVLIAPGERVDIIAGPFEAGDSFPLNALKYDRMTFLKARTHTYATVNVLENKRSVASIPEKLREIESLAGQDAQVNRKVKLSVGLSRKKGLDFLVNNEVHMNDNPVYVNELQVWEVSNTSRMDHPFHLHGFFFQILEINGQKPAFKSWKDTVNLPPVSKIKIAWMPDNRPGIWMYHCHILEHHAAGMMANFQVIDRTNNILTSKLSGTHHCHN